MNKLVEKILDFIFPKSALVREIENMTPEALLSQAKQHNETNSDFLSIFSYKNPIIRQAIWEIKYRKNEKIASLLAKCLFDELILVLSERIQFQNFTDPILVPMPISKERQKNRGFNQCEFIARKLVDLSDKKTFKIENNLLIKSKDTESQTKMGRKERLNNLVGSFSIMNNSAILGKNIILLDDVTTTGATLKEASSTLKKAGAKKIICITLAH